MEYTTDNVKKIFLKFFQNHQHKILPSSSLIPKKNSNLLFTNAGMNQFQNVFIGKEKPPFPQVATVQKCLRTGGKHNDLEQIGYSNYHNTFFEMLGNFSFGSYFKKEAICYAWKLLTDPNWFNIPKEKLIITVYYNDIESYDIWKHVIKIEEKSIIKIGDKDKKKYNSDNFWQMGTIGPCGPCTEIFFKKKEQQYNKNNINNKDNIIEIWNIVFIQYNKVKNNEIIPLKQSSVDTGMGLERITSILQNVNSNYEIDIFKKIIYQIKVINNIHLIQHQSLNVIADHIRAIIFIILDDIIPSNENRGYILRRLIRRSLIHGNKLGINKIFLYKLIPNIIHLVNLPDQDVNRKVNHIIEIIQQEEKQFIHTLQIGLKFLKSKIKKLKKNKIDFNFVFYLYDTLGFPIDLTKDICKEHNIIFNEDKLNQITIQRKNEIRKTKKYCSIMNYINPHSHSKFIGYKRYKIKTNITDIFIKDKTINEIKKEEQGIIFLEQTPFFGESGGQIGDEGIIYNEKFIFKVKNTKNFSNSIGHIGTVYHGSIKTHETVTAKINIKKRLLVQNNHSATHLLHYTLNKILQDNIEQKGSFISEKYLRFDFNYLKNINSFQLNQIEKIINKNITLDINIQDNYKSFEDAKKEGYSFLKNKNYQSMIRTLSIGNFSKEICKGTHATRTGKIRIFKIISCKKISFGTFRIEAITGLYALNYIHQQYKTIETIKSIFKSNENSIIKKIKKFINHTHEIKSKNLYLNQEVIKYQINELVKKNTKINHINYIIQKTNIKNTKLLKVMIDQLKVKLISAIIILFFSHENKYIFIVSVTKDIIKIITANKIIEWIKENTGGQGGGKLELSECIGYNIKNINQFTKKITNWISYQII